MSMQYRDFFSAVKFEFSFENFLYFSYFFFQNMDCVYMLEAVLTSTHNLCFGSKIRKIGIPL